jgi:hypothetical protein
MVRRAVRPSPDRWGRLAWDALRWQPSYEVHRWLRHHVSDWDGKLREAAYSARLWDGEISDAELVDVTDDKKSVTITFRLWKWGGQYFDESVTAGTFLGALLKACNPERLAARLDEAVKGEELKTAA